MQGWKIINEEASIVLVGDMTPRIFHPEWFINNGIVGNWEYKDDENGINSIDISQVNLPNDITITVVKDKLILRTARATEFSSLSDILTNVITNLSEMSIQIQVRQLGMNYTNKIKILDTKDWRYFGKQLAPHDSWKSAINYEDKEKLKSFGLLEMVMHMPRPDEFNGYIRPKIEVVDINDRIISFGINNHIQIESSNSTEISKILEGYWNGSISLASIIIKNIMSKNLEE